MRSILLQMLAVTTINLKSLPQRLFLSLATVIAVGLVVTVLLAFLAMANGFRRTIADSGAEDVAVVLRSGSLSEINSVVLRDQVRLIEDGPGIAKGGSGISFEKKPPNCPNSLHTSDCWIIPEQFGTLP